MVADTKIPLFPSVLAGFGLAILVLLVLPAEAVARKFTSSAGKVIEAELVGASESAATLKMADGKEVTAKTSLFSKEDQIYIADWLKKNPAQIRYKFDVDYSKKRLGKNNHKEGNVEVVREDWIYKLSIKNLSKNGGENANLTGIKVDYRIYKSSRADSRVAPQGSESVEAQGKYLVTNGSKTFESLPYLKDVEFDSVPVVISESELDPDRYYLDGGKSKRKDDLGGIWLKFYHQDKEVGEFKSADPALKTAIWK